MLTALPLLTLLVLCFDSLDFLRNKEKNTVLKQHKNIFKHFLIHLFRKVIESYAKTSIPVLSADTERLSTTLLLCQNPK